MKKDAMYAGILLPFKDYELKVKKRMQKAYEVVLLESFKKPKDSMKFVSTCLESIPSLNKAVNNDFQNIKSGQVVA